MSLPATAQWAQSLRNHHDELDPGRLTPKQQARDFEPFGPSKDMQLYNRGIRRRLAPMLGNRRQIELANGVLFSLPGTPVIRYGDEIGMGDDLTLNERDAVRTPMQWSRERNAGFSAAPKTVLPVISQGPYNCHEVNLEAQRRDPDSLPNRMSQMIRLRKECPEVGWGDWRVLDTGSPCVLALRYDWRGSSLIVVNNFDEKPHEIRLRPKDVGSNLLVNLLINNETRADERGVFHIAPDAYDYRWFHIGGSDPHLQRSRV